MIQWNAWTFWRLSWKKRKRRTYVYGAFGSRQTQWNISAPDLPISAPSRFAIRIMFWRCFCNSFLICEISFYIMYLILRYSQSDSTKKYLLIPSIKLIPFGVMKDLN